MINQLLLAFISWAIILPVLFLLGSTLRAFVPTRDLILRGIIFFALGLTLLSFTVVLLDLVYEISSLSIWLILGIIAFIRFQAFGELTDWLKAVHKEYSSPPTLVTFVMSLIAGAALLSLTLGSLAPEIGGDALCYHLYNPKVFLAQKSLDPLEFDLTSYFPLLINNLYVVGLATGGVFAAKLFHLLCGVLTFMLIERVVFMETHKKGVSLFAALVFFLTPGVYNQLSTTYIDIGVALFTLLAITMLVQAFRQGKGKAFFLAGLFLGCALSSKYLAMLSAAAISLVWVYRAVIDKHRVALITNFFTWCLGIALTAHFWLLRNWFAKGNPFYPFFGEWFGEAQRPTPDYLEIGMGKGILEFPVVFWNMFAHPLAFGAFPNRIGGIYCLLVPFILVAVWKNQKVREYAIFLFAFLIVWFNLAQMDRWLYPVLPVMVLLGGFGIDAADRMFSKKGAVLARKVGAFLAIGMLGVYLLGGVYHYRYAFKLYLGQPLESYLNNMERTYPIATWMNANLPEGSKILIDGEPSKFYIDHQTIAEGIMQWQLKYNDYAWDVSAYQEFLKSLGVTHVLIGDSVKRPFDTHDSLIRRWSQSSHAALLKEMKSKNIRDDIYWYQVYKVGEGTS